MNKYLDARTYDCAAAAAILGLSLAETSRLSRAHGIEAAARKRGPQKSPRYLPRQIITLRKCLEVRAFESGGRRSPLRLDDNALLFPGGVMEVVQRRTRVLRSEWKLAAKEGVPCDMCALRATMSSLRISDVLTGVSDFCQGRQSEAMTLCSACWGDFTTYRGSLLIEAGKGMEVSR